MRWLITLVWNLAVVCPLVGQSYTIATIAGGAPRPPVGAAKSSIGSPVGVAVDAAGNVYFAGLNCIFKLDQNGVLTRIAGNYTSGSSGDGGPATDAQLSFPDLFGYGPAPQELGIAVDAAGNVYVPDAFTDRVRKISTSGIITTVAGNGLTGGTDSGDGGPAIQAGISGPSHVAVDTGGNLYIATAFGRVRKVSPDGIISTVAGGGTFVAPSPDGVAAVGVYLGTPTGLAVDGAGNLYLAETGFNRVRKVSPAGIITTVAGNGKIGSSGDGGPATSAQLRQPTDLALDAAGNLYITDPVGYQIRKVSPDGTITTIAGNGSWGYAGDGGPATAAPVVPEGLAADRAGNLYVADFGSNRIRKISTAGIITTLAGDGTQAYSGDGGPALNAQLSFPGSMVTDHAGNLYVADRGNNRVRKISPDGTITTVAGNGSPGTGGDGGPATGAEVMPTDGLAFDGAGNLYIGGGNRLRKVSPGGIVTSVSGFGGNGPFPGPPTSSDVFTSNRIAVDSRGNIYGFGNGITKIAPDGTETRLTSNHAPLTGFAVDAADNLYFSDTLDNLIGKISPAGVVSYVAIDAGTGCGSGTGRFVPFEPWGLAVARSGTLYVADPTTSAIRRISPSGTMDTIAGNFTKGYSGDGGPATSAQLALPYNIAVDDAGNIYVADPVNNVIRVLKPIFSPPIALNAVTSAASNLSGPISPGELVVLYGVGIGPFPIATCAYGNAGLIATQLSGTEVFFNGLAARLFYTSAAQVAAVVPYAVTGNTALVSVSYQGRTSATVAVPVAGSAPALFTLDATGKGQAAAVNQNGSINRAATPANRGEFISLYATGEGQTSPGGVDGKLPSNPLPQPILPVTVTIGGVIVKPQYAGGAPGYFAGLMQINARIPLEIRPGSAVAVTIQVGTAPSQAGVTIAVAGN